MAALPETALFLALLAVAAATLSQASIEHPPRHEIIHPLRPRIGSSGQRVHGLTCASWMLAVETHNIVKWDTIPVQCKTYVGHYLLGEQYRLDTKFVVDVAIDYAQNFSIASDGRDVWVFDVDETSLSNLPYYATIGFGSEPFNETTFAEWEERSICPPMPETLRLYTKLLTLGFRIVFLTEKTEDKKRTVALNLIRAGFITWEKLVLKPVSSSGKTSLSYKMNERRQLEIDGYRIVGNIGDQWSDLIGTHTGLRTFKMPDPMYYVS